MSSEFSLRFSLRKVLIFVRRIGKLFLRYAGSTRSGIIIVSQTPIIRQFCPSDADAIIAITIEVFERVSIDAMIENAVGTGGARWQDVKAGSVRAELRANPAGCFVAEQDARPIGYVTTIVNRLASRGHVANLAVASAYQGRGTGRKLLERALDYFRSLGLAHAKIETLVHNKAGEHLYTSVGFRELTRQIHFIMDLEAQRNMNPASLKGIAR